METPEVVHQQAKPRPHRRALVMGYVRNLRPRQMPENTVAKFCVYVAVTLALGVLVCGIVTLMVGFSMYHVLFYL